MLACLLCSVPGFLRAQTPQVPEAGSRSGPEPEVSQAAPPDPTYLPELQSRAAALKLSGTRFWLLLGHNEPNWLGGYTSQADGPGLFLAPTGKTDPNAELHATLAAFFTPRSVPPGQMTAQCTFPARFRWLKEQLGFDEARLPEEPCPRFRAWQEALKPASVTFIFASFYVNNPASLFGHTLIRLDREGRSDSERLLDYTVNFAAIVPPNDNPITYTWRGLFGGYPGYFSLLPYYLKVREYADLDSRDLWEYRLTLNPDQIDWAVRHAWEMGSTWFDYYFFSENCSYHLLSLLEAADPTLHLRDEFPVWTLPTDTVRAVTGAPGLVKSVVYRPSRRSQMEQKLAQLGAAEQSMVVRLIRAPVDEPPGFAVLAPLQQALVLDAAADWFQYKLGGDPAGDPALRAGLRAILLRRSRLPVTYDSDAFPPLSQPPETGHRSSRVSAAMGEAAGPNWTKGGGTLDPFAPVKARRGEFLELGWYPVFHELLSDERGYAPNSQILLGDARVRVYPEWERATLERFAILDAISLFPLTPEIHQPSWRLLFAFERAHDRGCRDCVPFVANPGIGVAAETRWGLRWVAYALAEVDARLDPAYVDGYRAGLAGRLGVLVDLSPRWRAHLEAARSDYTAGQKGWTSQAALTQRITLGQNLELRVDGLYIEGDRQPGYREIKAGLGWFY